MCSRVVRSRNPESPANMCRVWFTNLVVGILIVLFSTVFYLTISFTPLSKEEHIEKFHKLNQEVEPFRKNLSECAWQVKASGVDVNNFLKRLPQETLQGKCFVACMLRRSSLIKNNKLSPENLMAVSRANYGDDSELLARINKAITKCSSSVADIFEICEYASEFNDCMHKEMEHIMNKLALERRMEALGRVTVETEHDEFEEEDEEVLQIIRDEL